MVGLLAKERNYRWLFFSGLVNGIGDRFSQVAVLTMLLELTGSGLAVGGALSIRIIPYLLFSYAGGAGGFRNKWCIIFGRIIAIIEHIRPTEDFSG